MTFKGNDTPYKRKSGNFHKMMAIADVWSDVLRIFIVR